MRIVPHDQLRVASGNNIDTVRRTLSSQVRRRGIFETGFAGTVTEQGFKLTYKRRFGNFWRPITTGRFTVGESGQVFVEAVVCLSYPAAVFSAALFGLSVLASVQQIARSPQLGTQLLWCGAPLSFWGFVSLMFWLEALPLRARLQTLLCAPDKAKPNRDPDAA